MTPPLHMTPQRHMLIDDYGHCTATAPAMDEWATEFPPGIATMNRAEMGECAELLGTLHELVGVQAEEVMEFLADVLVRRDGASMAMLRWLRRLDGQARGDA